MTKKIQISHGAKIVILLAALLASVYFLPSRWTQPFKVVFFKITYPVEKLFSELGRKTSKTFSFLFSIGELKSENERLIRENNQLNSQIGMLRDEERENRMLREQLELAPREKFDMESAMVIARDPKNIGNWIRIDKGSGSGIKTGMPVVVSDGILIGKIDSVYPDSSEARLLTDSSNAVNGLDLETGAKGIVKGEYGLGLVMDMVLHTDVLNEGDSVISSGLGGEFPRGLLMGKIQEVRTSQDKLFQQAVVMPPLRYSQLETVFVIKK